MKSIKNSLMVVGLFLQVGISFAWESTGPTQEDILVASKVENRAAKGSLEDRLIRDVQKGNLEDVKTLIAEGSNLEARDNGNMTALMIAAKKGYTDIAGTLLNAGAQVSARNSYGWTVLFYAVDNGHAGIVSLLIAKGAGENENYFGRNTFGELLASAASKGNDEVVKALIADDVSIDRLARHELQSVYMLARNKCSPETVNAIKERIEKLDI